MVGWAISDKPDKSDDNQTDHEYCRGDDGIELFQSDSNLIIGGNVVNFNGDAGIYLLDSNYNNIYDNTAKNNTYGLCLEDSSYNCISGNTLVNNTYNYNETGICEGNRDCRVAAGPSGGNGDSGASGDKAIPLGNYFFVFITISVITLIIIVRKRLKRVERANN